MKVESRLGVLGRDVSMTVLRQRVTSSVRCVGPFEGVAACQSPTTGLDAQDWTPEHEEESVPPRLRSVCGSCPLWEPCLIEAIRMGDIGYRAGTTTRQRRRLFPELAVGPRVSTRAPVSPSRRREGDTDRTPQHTPGTGSLNTYRRGCRCDECRGHNAAARRRERARAS